MRRISDEVSPTGMKNQFCYLEDLCFEKKVPSVSDKMYFSQLLRFLVFTDYEGEEFKFLT